MGSCGLETQKMAASKTGMDPTMRKVVMVLPAGTRIDSLRKRIKKSAITAREMAARIA